MRENDWFELFAELNDLQDDGVELYLGDEHSSPEEISSVCGVRECSYMRDYVTDERGCVSEVRFYKID